MTVRHGLTLAVLVCVGILTTAGCSPYKAGAINGFLCTPRDSVVSAEEYRIYPPDVVSFSSRTVPEISGVSQQVRPDGKINLVNIGEIYVAGKTPKQVEDLIVTAFGKIYEEPDVVVGIASYNSQRFYVFGQVASPGPKRWTGRDTLLDALASAQPTRIAWSKRIIVVRGDSDQVGGQEWPDGKKASLKYWMTGVHPEQEGNPRQKITVNLMAMVKSGDMSNNFLLKPNDVIYVQPTPLGSIGLAIQSLLFPVNPIVSAASTPSRVVSAAAIP